MIAFWVLAPIMVLAAVGMLFVRKAVHAALLMAVVMISLAVLYLGLEAPFLFAVQIIVYTGAIMMLFLFVLMLVGVDTPDSIVETLKGQRVASGLAAIGLLALIVLGIGGAIQAAPIGLADANAAYGGNVQGLAALIFGRYLFAFELTSALLITAAVAAMVLAHRRRVHPKPGQAELAQARMKAYAETGAHPGTLPNSGVLARHNSIATPALLPDGSVSEESVSKVLASRGAIVDASALSQATQATFEAIERVQDEEEE